MMKTRFTEERMVTMLRKDDQRPVSDVAKKHDVRAPTIYEYRRRHRRLKTDC
jgi:putative transposase